MLCLLGALTEQVKSIAPDLSFLLLHNARRDAVRSNHRLRGHLTLVEFFFEIHDLALDEHVLQFDAMCGFRLRRCKFRPMLYVVNLVYSLFDIVLDVELYLAHC